MPGGCPANHNRDTTLYPQPTGEYIAPNVLPRPNDDLSAETAAGYFYPVPVTGNGQDTTGPGSWYSQAAGILTDSGQYSSATPSVLVHDTDYDHMAYPSAGYPVVPSPGATSVHSNVSDHWEPASANSAGTILPYDANAHLSPFPSHLQLADHLPADTLPEDGYTRGRPRANSASGHLQVTGSTPTSASRSPSRERRGSAKRNRSANSVRRGECCESCKAKHVRCGVFDEDGRNPRNGKCTASRQESLARSRSASSAGGRMLLPAPQQGLDFYKPREQ